MLDALLKSSISRRGLVLFAVLLLGGLGAWNFTRLPIDAVPDITNVQVVVNTPAPGYTPLEVEQRVTFPLENAMAGIPRLLEQEKADAFKDIKSMLETYKKQREEQRQTKFNMPTQSAQMRIMNAFQIG